MDWKSILKPVAKWALKFGLNYGLEFAAGKVAAKPEKGKQITADVAKLGQLVVDDSVAIGDGKYDDVEKAKSDAGVDAIVDAIFAY